MTAETTATTEADEILGMLHNQRKTLRTAARGLTDAQAMHRSTVSDLTIGGLVKHVANTEAFWTKVFAREDVAFDFDPEQYVMPEDTTIAGLLDRYAEVAAETERVVRAAGDLGETVQLPEFPWAPGQRDTWARRRVLLHLLREIAHHCGHADIIREAIDGASTTMQMAEINASD
ncbi:MAG TPA: DinB family protein [Streptosporangiaceae bacterium]|jgi:uncharacterized damage-inducible protein DinB